jgi:hypothetical protein
MFFDILCIDLWFFVGLDINLRLSSLFDFASTIITEKIKQKEVTVSVL